MTRPILTLAAAALALALGARGVRADESEDRRIARSQALIEQAEDQYNVGEFDKAIDLLKQAWGIWPHPVILFDLCQCYRQKKDWDRAIFQCKAYVRADPKSDKRAMVESLIKDMEATAAKQKETQERPPEGLDHPEDQGKQPANSEKQTTVVPIPTETRTVDRVAPWYRDPVGWTLVGGGVALVATSGFLQASALSLHDDAEAALDPMTAADLQGQAGSRQTLAIVLGGAGLVATTVGVIKLMKHDSARSREPTPTRARYDVRPLGVGLVLEGTF